VVTRRELVLALVGNSPKRGGTRLRNQPFARPADLLEHEAELEAVEELIGAATNRDSHSRALECFL
jgi:hypothetical protein